jgi:hypothetical protein
MQKKLASAPSLAPTSNKKDFAFLGLLKQKLIPRLNLALQDSTPALEDSALTVSSLATVRQPVQLWSFTPNFINLIRSVQDLWEIDFLRNHVMRKLQKEIIWQNYLLGFDVSSCDMDLLYLYNDKAQPDVRLAMLDNSNNNDSYNIEKFMLCDHEETGDDKSPKDMLNACKAYYRRESKK